MGLFDKLKKSSGHLAAAVSAVPAVLEGELGGITATIAKTATATSPNTEPESVRSLIERVLVDGPKPYAVVLESCGGDEDALRDAIRDWPELIAYDSGGTWCWEIVTDPIALVERIEMKYEQENASGNAPSCPEREAGHPTEPLKEETALPARFGVGDHVRFAKGDRVRFSRRTALNVEEGTILLIRTAPGGILWFQVMGRSGILWISENHVQEKCHEDRD